MTPTMTCSASTVTPTATPKFHFSLWVADLERTVAFYRVLFGQEPHKKYVDYAKFEVAEPPLVLSFLPQPAPRGASLNHVGLRLPDSAGLVEVQRRLEQAGYSTRREDGVECCYARQTKFWVVDPDGVNWEIYTVHEDIGHHGKGRPPQAVTAPAADLTPMEGVWTHILPDAFPERIPAEDAGLEEVQLMNTVNAPGGMQAFRRALAEVARVLRPGGRVVLRGLAGDRPYPGTPDFPGLSAKYRYVPMPCEPLAALVEAGFRGIEITTWKDVGCVKDSTGVVFRVVAMTAWKTAGDGPPAFTAQYHGPFAQLTDDDGTVFPQGVAVAVSADRAEQIRNGPVGSAFTLTALT